MLEVKYDVLVPDFYCMLAKAMDYDELDLLRNHIALGNKKSAFKWSSIDRAGTLPLPKRGISPGEALIIAIQDNLLKGQKVAVGGRKSAEGIAKGQGREMAYICPDGTTRDSSRREIERTPDHIPYSFRDPKEFESWLLGQSTKQR